MAAVEQRPVLADQLALDIEFHAVAEKFHGFFDREPAPAGLGPINDPFMI